MDPQATELTRALSNHPLLQKDPFVLIDVGCHGGIMGLEKIFSPHAICIGFDIEANEVARLNALPNKPAQSRYVHQMVAGLPSSPDSVGSINTGFFQRTASHQVCQFLGIYDAMARAQNAPAAPEHNPIPPATLDEMVKTKNIPAFDFIKIDTDGMDLSILRAAENSLQNCKGILVECAMNGPQGETDNLFRNVDRYLQKLGFSFYNILPHRYAHAAMPLPFRSGDPSQSETGQIVSCDALYFRDYALPQNADTFDLHNHPENLWGCSS